MIESFGVEDRECFDYFEKIKKISDYFLKRSSYYKRRYIILSSVKLGAISFIPLYLVVYKYFPDFIQTDFVSAICSFIIAICEGFNHLMHCEEKRINYMKTTNYLHAEQRQYATGCGYYNGKSKEEQYTLFVKNCEAILREESDIWNDYIKNEKQIVES